MSDVGVSIKSVVTDEQNILESEKFEPIKLDETIFAIPIPESVIMDTSIDPMRVAVYCYLYSKVGRDNTFVTKTDYILNWLHKKRTKYKGCHAERIATILKNFVERGYISISECSEYDDVDLMNLRQFHLFTMNMKKINEELDKYPFTIVYSDEVEKILNNQNSDSKNKYFHNTSVLMLFTYLRKIIGKRIESNYKSNNYWAEAWGTYYINISESAGLQLRSISKYIGMLKSLDLIAYERVRSIKLNDGSFRTGYAIFANTYKREGSYVTAYGEDYYQSEIKRRKMTIISSNN